MRQHNVWCVCVVLCVERYAGLHTKHHAAASPQLTFYIKKK